MDEPTRRMLRTVNRRFYEHHAAAFSGSRERPWPGWRRVLANLPPGPLPAVLDVGCGNGRFGSFLAGLRPGARYVGVDGCAELLRISGRRLAGLACELHHLDVLAADLDAALGGERFDLVTLFGVLHHVPGRRARRDLLCRLARLVAPGGSLAASIWRLDRSDRFARLAVSWEGHNLARSRRGEERIDLERLEAGDALLGWGGKAEPPRYCHFPDAAEIESWIEAVGMPRIDRFEADGPSGRDNLYLHLGARETTSLQDGC